MVCSTVFVTCLPPVFSCPFWCGWPVLPCLSHICLCFQMSVLVWMACSTVFCHMFASVFRCPFWCGWPVLPCLSHVCLCFQLSALVWMACSTVLVTCLPLFSDVRSGVDGLFYCSPVVGVNGTLDIRVIMLTDQNTPAPVMRLDGDGPVVFGAVRGNPDLTRIHNERPPDNILIGTTGLPLCDIMGFAGLPQYETPMRYPGRLNPVTCGECQACPNGTIWSPVTVRMPVLTPMYKANDNPDPEDLYYVMDVITLPVACSCQVY